MPQPSKVEEEAADIAEAYAYLGKIAPYLGGLLGLLVMLAAAAAFVYG